MPCCLEAMKTHTFLSVMSDHVGVRWTFDKRKRGDHAVEKQRDR
jgi:hypothetical protein